MCWTMYLGSTIEAPCIASEREGRSVFGVALIESEEASLLEVHLPFPHLRGLISSGNCGCDFPTNRGNRLRRTDRRRYDADRQALSEYLRALLAVGATVSMYCCWAGELDRPRALARDLSPATLASRFTRSGRS